MSALGVGGLFFPCFAFAFEFGFFVSSLHRILNLSSHSSVKQLIFNMQLVFSMQRSLLEGMYW